MIFWGGESLLVSTETSNGNWPNGRLNKPNIWTKRGGHLIPVTRPGAAPMGQHT